MNLHLLGGPGSGKTTLARAVATWLQVPHYDLDLLGRKHGPHAAPLVADLFVIAEQPGRVTEGIYLFFTEPLLQQADAIVLLDVEWRTAAWRIIRRHVAANVRGTNQYPGWNGWKALWALLRYARSYYLDRRPDMAEAVRLWLEDGSALIEPRTANEVITYTERHSALVGPPTGQFVRQYLKRYTHKLIVVKNNADRARLLQRFTNR